MLKLINYIASCCQLSSDGVEAARSILRKPDAMLTLIKQVPPLPKESLQDPDLIYAYPSAYVQWSMCMHGLVEWDTAPVLSYADYVAQLDAAFLQPTDIVVGHG